jgi:hypothetical protein
MGPAAEGDEPGMVRSLHIWVLLGQSRRGIAVPAHVAVAVAAAKDRAVERGGRGKGVKENVLDPLGVVTGKAAVEIPFARAAEGSVL